MILIDIDLLATKIVAYNSANMMLKIRIET